MKFVDCASTRVKKVVVSNGLTDGYREYRDHESMATIIRFPINVTACRVSMRIFGIFRSAGTNICLVDCKERDRKRSIGHL